MLQDFLASRAAISSDSTAPEIATPRESGFQPFFAARAADLAPAGGSRRIEEIRGSNPLDSPQIELVEENGKVQRIVVTCTCCKRIEIECEY